MTAADTSPTPDPAGIAGTGLTDRVPAGNVLKRELRALSRTRQETQL